MSRLSAKGIAILDAAAWTPAGNAHATAQALLDEKVLLALHPARWSEGDLVPLALDNPAAETAPPRWWNRLKTFVRPLMNNGWGSRRRPVVVTSSNFGVGNLQAYRESGDARHLDWGTPHACAERIREAFGWGENTTLFSHACVTAQLALVHGQRLLERDLADEVLVVSFDFLSPFVVGGFHALKILNGHFPAPYTDREIGSIGLGDGAAYAILGHSAAGGKAQIVAQSLHNELAHFTANKKDGSGFRALLGQLPLDAIRFWVKGHGTGTLEAGKMECVAVATAAPDAPLVSWKGALGHTLGSCALVELGVALAAIEIGSIPATVGAGEETFTPQVARKPFSASEFEAVLMLSNAFGGAHGGMLLRYA